MTRRVSLAMLLCLIVGAVFSFGLSAEAAPEAPVGGKVAAAQERLT